MEEEIRKLRKSLKFTEMLCVLMLILFLGIIVGLLQFVRVYGEYKEDIRTAVTLVQDLKKVNLKQLSEDIHATSEAIAAVDWEKLSEQLNELDLKEIKTTIDSLDLDRINETLGELNIDQIAHTLEGLDVDKINQTMDDVQSALSKLDRFGLF